MPPKKYDYERVTFTHEGKQHHAYGKTLKEAHAKAAKMQLALENGEAGISNNMTVKRWTEEWLETYKAHVVGDAQYRNYLTHINGVIIPAIGAKRLKDVKDVELQRILNSRVGYSKSDLLKLRGTLKAIFKRARVSRLIPYDPAEELEVPAAKDGIHRSITPAERKAILRYAEEHYAGLWVKTILYCGLRPGETRALDWRHIDFENRKIRVEQAMKASSKEIGDPKSESGMRKIPITTKLLDEFAKARRGPFEPGFLQPTTTGKRHTKRSMNCLWGNFKRGLDISLGCKVYRNQIIVSMVAPDLVPYCLRHTYGTDLQAAGVPINIAKYLMGHSDISVTANIYTHTTDAMLDDVEQKINTYIGNK